jgi:hypothetical protein
MSTSLSGGMRAIMELSGGLNRVIGRGVAPGGWDMEYEDDCGVCHVMKIVETEVRRGKALALTPEQVVDNWNGKLFESFLKDCQLTPATAAAALGVSAAAIADLRAGRKHADETILERLASMAPAQGRMN